MFIFIISLLIIGIISLILVEGFFLKGQKRVDLSVYERKPYIFDTNSEFVLYKMLIELFGDKYFVFTQVNYSHLIQPKKIGWKEERRYRSRIDRKSADFVLCDKEKVVPILIIELDGGVHNTKGKRSRDEFIDEITKIADLPILHIKNSELNRDYIRENIINHLSLANVASKSVELVSPN